MTATSDRIGTRRVAILLGLAALVLNGPFIGWGLPHATSAERIKTPVTDEILPLEGLAEMHSTFVESAPDRNYGYPWFQYFVVSAAQAPYLGWLRIHGELGQFSSAYPYGLDDPVSGLAGLTRVGRSVSVFMAAGMVVLTFLIGTVLWGRAVGLSAALLTQFSELIGYYAGTGNLDVPAAFFGLIGLLAYALILEHGLTPTRAAWLGLGAAFATATKDQAAVIFVPLGLALLLPGIGRAAVGAKRWKALGTGLLVASGLYLLASGVAFDPARHWIHVRRLVFEQGSVVAGNTYHTPYAGFGAVLAAYGRTLWVTLTPAIATLALIGAIATWRSTPRRLLLLLPFAGLFVMILLPTGYVPRRYLVPLVPLADLFAAIALVRLSRSLATKQVGWAMLLLLVGWRAAGLADLRHRQIHETRDSAANWLAPRLAEGQAVGYFGLAGKLPALEAGTLSERIGPRLSETSSAEATSQVGRLLGRNGPDYILVIPDWTSRSGMPHSGDCPSEIFRALSRGGLGYTEVRRFEAASPVPRWLAAPAFDSPMVSPPIRVFAREEGAGT